MRDTVGKTLWVAEEWVAEAAHLCVTVTGQFYVILSVLCLSGSFHGCARLEIFVPGSEVHRNIHTHMLLSTDTEMYRQIFLTSFVSRTCVSSVCVRDSQVIMLSSSELSGSMSFSLAFSVLSLNILTSSWSLSLTTVLVWLAEDAGRSFRLGHGDINLFRWCRFFLL